MMDGAGLGDVLIPKKEFVKEHERLVALLNQSDIPALRKEAREQKAELAERGGSNPSNFIARMMAEAKYKHRSAEEKRLPYDKKTAQPGKYVRGSVMDPEDDDTTMSQAIKFNYNKLASASQSRNSENKKGNPYGASPFIAHHFGNAKSKPRETAIQSAARNKWRKGVRARAPAGEDEEEEEEINAAEKREIAREALKRRKREAPFSNVILPESHKRKERRNRQEAKKRESDAARRAAIGDEGASRAEKREREERAAELERNKKERESRPSEGPVAYWTSNLDEVPYRPKGMTVADMRRYMSSRNYQQLLEQREFERKRRDARR